MSIRPVDMSGMTMRTQEISSMKSNEDAKPFVQQLSIESDRDRAEQRDASRVKEQNNSDQSAGRFDAREKGSNEYQNNRKKTAVKKEKKDMAVVKKTTGGFDVSI